VEHIAGADFVLAVILGPLLDLGDSDLAFSNFFSAFNSDFGPLVRELLAFLFSFSGVPGVVFDLEGLEIFSVSFGELSCDLEALLIVFIP